MSKIKYIAIISIAAIIIALAGILDIYVTKYNAEKADRDRLWRNNMELMAAGRSQLALIYTKDEFIRVMSDSLKSALDSLKIKPKQVVKVIYRTIVDIDTVDRPVYVDYRKTYWEIADTGECFVWNAMAFISDTSLSVIRTNYEYNNHFQDYYYETRPKKFLFIRYGKKKIIHVSTPECGAVTEKVIEVIKNN